jgi:hypothetical protein
VLPLTHFFCEPVQSHTCEPVQVCVAAQSPLSQHVPLTQVNELPLVQVL